MVDTGYWILSVASTGKEPKMVTRRRYKPLYQCGDSGVGITYRVNSLLYRIGDVMGLLLSF